MAATTFTQQMKAERLRQLTSRHMDIEHYEILKAPSAVIAFRGRMKGDTETAFDRISG